MKGANLIRKLVDLALEEDLAFGDITSALTVPEDHRSKASIIARQRLVVCGCEVLPVILQEGRWGLELEFEAQDGEELENGAVIAKLQGLTRELLAAERTMLNFLQRLSGVATYTRDFCSIEPALIVLDTRKTLPAWRVLDKYGVRVGGGRNHRFCLGDMVLVKNNHIDAHPKGMRGALEDIAANKPLYMPWEVEVRNLDELRIALEYSPNIIMLDNFSDPLIVEAVKLVRTSARGSNVSPMIEVSGGITRERLTDIRSAGADAVSVGALTTQAPNVDISMRIGS
jgi:nicotinate-nucleotide pyrophosphorylase (carboxylating)